MKALNIATCHLIEDGYVYGRSPIVEISGECLYRQGDYSIYKHGKNAYLHLWKNVILVELCGENYTLIDYLAVGIFERISRQFELVYKTAKEHKADAEKYAKLYDFTIL